MNFLHVGVVPEDRCANGEVGAGKAADPSELAEQLDDSESERLPVSSMLIVVKLGSFCISMSPRMFAVPAAVGPMFTRSCPPELFRYNLSGVLVTETAL